MKTNSAIALEANTIDLKRLSELMQRLLYLEKRISDNDRDDRMFKDAIQRTALGLFSLVVMGEIKKGKSSFINAMLGIPDLVPVASDVATSTIYKIRYGKEISYYVHFLPCSKKTKLQIPVEELRKYGTEVGKTQNDAAVDFIEVLAPSKILEDGLIVVDTPGVGGLFKEHRDITFKHAPKSDAVFFITDSIESPIGADEISFLKELRKITNFIYFVQTKGDMVDAESREKRRLNNLKILLDAGFEENQIKYFVVSSKLKQEADKSKNSEDLIDSGFLKIIGFLKNDLKAKKDVNLAMLSVHKTLSKISSLKSVIDIKKGILDADTNEKKEKIKADIQNVESELQKFIKGVQPAIIREFSIELGKLKVDSNTMLNNTIKVGGEIYEKIEKRVSLKSSAHEIYADAENISNDIKAETSEYCMNLFSECSQKANALINALVQKNGAALVTQLGTISFENMNSISGTSLEELAKKKDDSNFFNSTRNTLYGGTFGMMALGMASLIITPVFPFAGAILASPAIALIGGIWGGIMGKEQYKEQEKEKAKNDIMNRVGRMLSNSQIEAQRFFTIGFNQIEEEAKTIIENLNKDAVSRLIDQKNELKKRETLSDAAVRKQVEEIKQLESGLYLIQKELDTIARGVAM